MPVYFIIVTKNPLRHLNSFAYGCLKIFFYESVTLKCYFFFHVLLYAVKAKLHFIELSPVQHDNLSSP